MEVRFDDKLSIPSQRKIQATGQMISDCAIARTGILTYAAKELGSLFADKEPNSLVRVAQLSDDLFDEGTLEKFRCAPVTIGHPADDVSTENMKELGVGVLEGKPFQDGDKLAASLVINDAEAIDLVNAGTKELSVRAYYELKRVDDSADYDAVRTIKTVNHVAIVERGRAGATCRISDSEDGEVEVVEEHVAEIHIPTVEEHQESVVETMEEVLDPSKGELDAALEKILALEEAAKEAAEAMTKLEAELDATKEKVLSDEAIEALVEERIAFRTEVAKLSDMDVSGMKVIDAKRAVVAAVTGMKMDDRDEVYVNARYEILLEDSEEVTPMAKVLGQVVLSDSKVEKKVYVNPAEAARLRSIARNSHKGDK